MFCQMLISSFGLKDFDDRDLKLLLTFVLFPHGTMQVRSNGEEEVTYQQDVAYTIQGGDAKDDVDDGTDCC